MSFRRLLAPLLLLLSCQAFADPPVYPAVRLPKPPTIDGTVDEAEWAGAPVVKGLVDDVNGTPAPFQGTFRLAYDEKYVYLAAILDDPDPKGIRAVEFRTNVSVENDDNVEFRLDPAGAFADANRFSFNPRGATNVQLAGGRAAKREWLGDFVAKARVTDRGWEGEARIPWSIMRLPGAGPHDARFNIRRNVARIDRSYVHTFTDNGRQADTPIWKDVVYPPTYVDRSIKLLPYLYGGYDPESGYVANAGLDLKTALSDQIQVVGSINPDFRNIENQILSLDFSRFERLAGEVRPFFLEGRQYIQNQLLATQRIPNFDVGANVYGRLGDKTTFGVLNTFDADTRFGKYHRGVVDNFAATVNHQPDPTLRLQGAVTSVTTPGVENNAYLLRAVKNIGALTGGFTTSGDQDSQLGWGVKHNAFVSYEKLGLGGYLDAYYVNDAYLPRLAYVPERNLKGFEGGTYYERNFNRGIFNSIGGYLGYGKFSRTDGGFYRRSFNGNFGVTFRNLLNISAGSDNGDFEGSRDGTGFVAVNYPSGNPYRNIGGFYTSGRQAGEHYDLYSVGGAYRIGNRLQLNGSYQMVQYYGFNDLGILSANYDLDAYRSVGGRFVKQGTDLGGYASFRQAGNTGIEYFLLLGAPNAAKFRPSIILKMTIPFQIGGVGH